MTLVEVKAQNSNTSQAVAENSGEDITSKAIERIHKIAQLKMSNRAKQLKQQKALQNEVPKSAKARLQRNKRRSIFDWIKSPLALDVLPKNSPLPLLQPEDLITCLSLDIDSSNYDSLSSRGHECMIEGDWGGAIQAFTVCYGLKPANVESLVLRSKVT
jgi:hypothetical protein